MKTFSQPSVVSIEEHTKKGKKVLDEAFIENDSSKYTEAIEEYKNALSHAFLFQKEIVPCLVNLGIAQISAGHVSDGLSTLTSLLEDKDYSKEASSSTFLSGHILYYIGVAHSKLKETQKAISFFNKAIREYRKDENATKYVCDTLTEMAELYERLGDDKQALSLMEEASDRLLNECNNVEQSSKSKLRQVEILMKSNDSFNTERAIKLLQLLLVEIEKVDASKLKCEMKMNAATKLFTLGEQDQALKCYDNVLGEVQSKGGCKELQKLKANILLSMARIFAQQQDYEKSNELAVSAADIFGKHGKRKLQGNCFFLFAENQYVQNLFGKSYQTYTHALQAFKDTDDIDGQWRTYERMADICMRKKSFDKAVQCYQFAFKIQAHVDKVTEKLISKLGVALKNGGKHLEDTFEPNLNYLQFGNVTENNMKMIKSSLKSSPERPDSSRDQNLENPKVKFNFKKVVEMATEENIQSNKSYIEEDSISTNTPSSSTESTLDVNESDDLLSDVIYSGVPDHSNQVKRREEVPMRYPNRGLSALTIYSSNSRESIKIEDENKKQSLKSSSSSSSNDLQYNANEKLKKKSKKKRKKKSESRRMSKISNNPVDNLLTTKDDDSSLPLTEVSSDFEEVSNFSQKKKSHEKSVSSQEPPSLPPRNYEVTEDSSKSDKSKQKKSKNNKSKSCLIM